MAKKMSKYAAIVATGLIAIPLLALAVSGFPLITYIQEDTRLSATQHVDGAPFICEERIHEAAYSRVAIGLLSSIVLFIPYRRRQPWAWGFLFIVALYFLRIFAFPPGTSLPTWKDLEIPMFRRMLLFNWGLATMFLLGLGTSLVLRSSKSRDLGLLGSKEE